MSQDCEHGGKSEDFIQGFYDGFVNGDTVSRYGDGQDPPGYFDGQSQGVSLRNSNPRNYDAELRENEETDTYDPMQYASPLPEMKRLSGPPESETWREHGGTCPDGWVTATIKERYGIVGYVPSDAPKQDSQGWYLPAGTLFIDSGGR